MIAETTVPTTITPDAAERIAELGIQADVERMLERAREVVTGLLRLELVLVDPYDTGDEPYLTILATRAQSYWSAKDPVYQLWDDWVIATFAPDVYSRIAMLIQHEADHAR